MQLHDQDLKAKIIKKPAMRFYNKFKAFVIMKIIISAVYFVVLRTYLFLNNYDTANNQSNQEATEEIINTNLDLFYFSVVCFVTFLMCDIYFWIVMKNWVDKDDYFLVENEK